MRLASVRIQNFRTFRDETIYLNDYTSLVGPNGGGKSTVLTALNIFFRETSHSQTDLLKLDEEDFHHRNTKDPIIITVTFEDLSADAQADFKDYARHGQLVVSAVATWNDEDGYAQVLQYGQRLGMADFKPFFKAEGDGASVAELKKLYASIRETHGDLPAPGIKQAMIDALREYEAARPETCVLIPSEDQFYGVSKGSNRLQQYVQWIFVPAVKDASTEQVEAKKTALGMLLERTVRSKVTFKEPLDTLREEFGDKYQTILDGQQGALKDLSDSLKLRLCEWAHADTSVTLEWQNDEQTAIKVAEPFARLIAGEGAFKGMITRFGHGLQRCFILALLEELSQHDAASGPKLILGCEEPELYQHPPQARHLASVIEKLTTKNAQVILCTHSPYFISGRGVEDVRAIRRDPAKKATVCRQLTFTQIAETIGQARGEKPVKPSGMMLKIQQALQTALNEIFFTNILVLVEGLEDVAYISTYLTLAGLSDEFRKHGCHLVPAGGKSCMAQPLSIALHLKTPTFVVFDSDRHSNVPSPTDTPEAMMKKEANRAMHEKDNLTLLKLCGIAAPNAFPANTLWEKNVVMWHSDIGHMVAEDLGAATWAEIGNSVRSKYSIVDVGDIKKNSLFIGYRLMEAWEQGKKVPTLETLCNAIIKFAADAAKPAAHA